VGGGRGAFARFFVKREKKAIREVQLLCGLRGGWGGRNGDDNRGVVLLVSVLFIEPSIH